MFSKKSPKSAPSTDTARLPEFSFYPEEEIYLDSACQSLRPLPVQDALKDYYSNFNACGGRVKYAWGQKVDKAVEQTRSKVLELLELPPKEYRVSFTLNTTYGINLLLSQLPAGKFSKVVTSEIEHNSVFLPTITLARRLGVERVVLSRSVDGSLEYQPSQLNGAVVVVNAVSNIDGRQLKNVQQLTQDVHAAGGIVIIDAAQAMAHHYELLCRVKADAVVFSAHKMYAPSLGVVVARKELLESLAVGFVGGGMVTSVDESDFALLPDELESRLEPGLQDFGAITALGTAIDWLQSVKPDGKKPGEYVGGLGQRLFDGLSGMSGITIFNNQPSTVITIHSSKHDAHQLAIYLSAGKIMARSGTFCCHYYLLRKQSSPPLLRFSLGLHNTSEDIDNTIATLGRIQRG